MVSRPLLRSNKMHVRNVRPPPPPPPLRAYTYTYRIVRFQGDGDGYEDRVTRVTETDGDKKGRRVRYLCMYVDIEEFGGEREGEE